MDKSTEMWLKAFFKGDTKEGDILFKDDELFKYQQQIEDEIELLDQ